MRKVKVGAVIMIFVMLAGCTNQLKSEKEETKAASFDEIVTAIKEQVAEDMKEGGFGEEVFVDGNLASYLETDLTAPEESDSAIWIEKLGLNKEEIANGRVITAMMNVNADEIIVIEAKEEKHVESLKAALERELDNQDQTWKQYLPDQYEKVGNNSIIVNGKYLLYVTYTQPDRIEKVFNSSFK